MVPAHGSPGGSGGTIGFVVLGYFSSGYGLKSKEGQNYDGSSFEKSSRRHFRTTIYEEKKKNKWPGFAFETENICKELGIEDCNITELNKVNYKKLITVACHKINEGNLRSVEKGECERLSFEDYGKKDYYSINIFTKLTKNIGLDFHFSLLREIT